MSEQRRSQALSEEEHTYLVALGERIRAIRQERNLRMEEFADLAGIHRTHLWKIEKGQLNAGIVSYYRLAQQLGLPLGSLFPTNELSSQSEGVSVEET